MSDQDKAAVWKENVEALHRAQRANLLQRDRIEQLEAALRECLPIIRLEVNWAIDRAVLAAQKGFRLPSGRELTAAEVAEAWKRSENVKELSDKVRALIGEDKSGGG